MLNVTHTLAHMNISATSVACAIQDVRELITVNENVAYNTRKFIKSLLGLEVKLSDNDQARVTALAVIEQVIKCKCEVADEEDLYNKAVARAEAHMRTNPWMYVKVESVTSNQEQKAVAEGIDTKVSVRANGSIGRGGKQILAAALFKLHVTDSKTPCDNSCFVKILMKELQMTLPGARTYAHNLRKAAGMVV
jgi:hypothetical protein